MSKLTYERAKRALDVVGAGLGLVAATPVMLCAAAAVKLDDPRSPILFRQPRAGRDGVPFNVLKFRSMRPGDGSQSAGAADHDPQAWIDGVPDDFVYKSSAAADARVTRVGAWLRRTSIDELPQLVNVLRGDMSLVGPRPEVLPIVERYDARQRRRLEVKPGITGWAQVNGRADATHGAKIHHDLHYVEHASLALDLRILAATVAAVLRTEGAH